MNQSNETDISPVVDGFAAHEQAKRAQRSDMMRAEDIEDARTDAEGKNLPPQDEQDVPAKQAERSSQQ